MRRILVSLFKEVFRGYYGYDLREYGYVLVEEIGLVYVNLIL